MSRKGNCHDNAAMESWFGTLKTELGETFETHAEGERKLFEYIEVCYNQKRRHSSLGYVSPAEFERSSPLSSMTLHEPDPSRPHRQPTGCQSPPGPPSIHNERIGELPTEEALDDDYDHGVEAS